RCRDIQVEIVFCPITARMSFVMAAVAGLQHDRLNRAHVWDSMRPHERLDGFGYVSARHQRFSIQFNHGKPHPTSSAIDHGFTAAAHKLQRVIGCLCLYFRPGRDDFRRQAVKLRDVVDTQIIMPVYLDDLPLGGSNRNRGCKVQASEDKRENRTTLYWEGHTCAYAIKNR